MNEHLGYEKYVRDDELNYRNGTKPKIVRSKSIIVMKNVSA